MSIEDRNLKPGTVLVARYKKRDHRCEVVKGEGGNVLYKLGNKTFTSPSRAGTEVMGGVACNGWRFWTVEGAEKAKAAKPAPKAKASTKPAKPATKAKNAPKTKKAAARAPQVAGGATDEPTEAPTVEKPVNCGDCGQEFPTSREAGNHMRDAHNSPEAAGGGGR